MLTVSSAVLVTMVTICDVWLLLTTFAVVVILCALDPFLDTQSSPYGMLLHV